MPFVVEITTPRLRLRRFTPADLAIYHEVIYGDAEVMKTLPGGLPRSLESVEWMLGWHARHWDEHGCGFFAVELLETGQFIGHSGVFMWGLPTFELGYAYGHQYWGQGYASEAGRACLEHAFAALPLEQIDAVTLPGNTASQKVLLKLGFQPAGERQAYDSRLPYFTLPRAEFFRLNTDDEG
ncbi:MAG: GNAT family N-acetyltransferase [Chloroflexi bacterium]|nr:GNAT family N-acetyltransferase [Chloroflexota bacterium]